jgi:hypothetical protein
MPRLVFALLLAAAFCHAQEAASTNVPPRRSDLVIRHYTEMPNVIELALKPGESPVTRELVEWKGTLAANGVTWPEGSWARHTTGSGEVVVCNTRENLDRMEAVIAVVPRQIQVDAFFVAFDLTNIARVVTSGQKINTATMTALWTNGFGELLAAPTVVTKAGQEAVIKGCTEYIYPTQFTVIGLDPVNRSNGTAPAAVVEPGAFQTCDLGVILQVVPDVNMDRLINLTFNPQVVGDPVWEDFGTTLSGGGNAQHLPMRQPFFHVYGVSTSVNIADGQRVLVGGGMPSRDRKKAVYLFVSATLIDLDGEAAQSRRSAPSAHETAKPQLLQRRYPTMP